MQKLTERMRLLGFLANLHKDGPERGEEVSNVRKLTPMESKSEPKGDQNPSNNRPSERVAKMMEKHLPHKDEFGSFWEPCWQFFKICWMLF